jgi:hypothetical protein
MSKRTFFLRRPSQSLALMLMFICAALQLLPAFVSAQTVAEIHLGGYQSYPGGTAYTRIYFDQGTEPASIGGFDFLIGYDSQILTLLSADPGEGISNCGWEYFTYRTSVNSDCTDSCPSSLVRLVGLADINNGSPHPLCFTPPDGSRLAYMAFKVSPSAILNEHSLLSFYWKDCGDNVISSASGDSLFFASSVYPWYGTPPLPTPGALPSLNGTPETCITAHGRFAMRGIDYYNGVVFVRPAVTTLGDLNLNGVSNEIADLVVFWNYYYLGMSAFTSTFWREQIWQSDVNGDGATLTFRDLVFLYRIIIGDTPPLPKSSTKSVSATFIQDTIASNVTVASGSNLAGVLLRFEGLIEPTLNWPVQYGWAGFWPDTARNMTIGIWLGPDRGCCGNSTMLTYTGKGKLIQAEVADWSDSDVKTKIVVTGGTPIYGDVDGSGRINIADVIYLITYIFQGGSYPVDPYHGDMDCDGSHDISDAIYLLNYIFAGGPAPCGIVR